MGCVDNNGVKRDCTIDSILKMAKLIQSTLRCIAIFCLVFGSSLVTETVHAASDLNVLKARKAFDQENTKALTKYTKQLQVAKHLLAPYAEYWLITSRIHETDNASISAFIHQYEDYAFAQRLRADYLKKLGAQQNWALFAIEYARVQPTNDSAVECLSFEQRFYQNKITDLTPAKYLWLTDEDQPKDCDLLFDEMQKSGVIDEEAVWQRFRLAIGKNRLGLAKAIIKRSKDYQFKQIALLKSAARSPARFVRKSRATMNTRFDREVNLFALSQLAKKDTRQAVNAFNKIEKRLHADERYYFYATMALQSAKRHEAEALSIFKKADIHAMNKEQIAWYARAALRVSDWAHLLFVINQMPAETAEQARWRYWKARALVALNQDHVQAVQLLSQLASERHYYGWLAQDEIKQYTPPTLLAYHPTKKEIAEFGALAAVIRIKALLDLDLRREGKLEWKNVIADFDDKQLLAAAYYANQQQWYDLAINTADQTRELHDFATRYPMPYKNLMRKAAQQHRVDETWVHGITRQESRFMHYAKSHAGAAGLMQLMPTTARWAAKRAGVNRYKTSMINELDVNVKIGTYYLSHTLELMDGNKVMATAGYNAGPSRGKKWRADRILEGAIYAETIPFDETRVYVQRVMANMMMYQKQLGNKAVKLKKLMGTVPAKPNSE